MASKSYLMFRIQSVIGGGSVASSFAIAINCIARNSLESGLVSKIGVVSMLKYPKETFSWKIPYSDYRETLRLW
jgi:hypothetical protein